MIENNTKQKIIAALSENINTSALERKYIEPFCVAFLNHLPLSILAKLSNNDISSMITNIWQSLQQPLINNPIVSLKEEFIEGYKTSLLFLTMVNIDHPYIIDSLQTFLAKWNLKPLALLHPVLNVQRDKSGKLQHINYGYLKDLKQPQTGRFESVVFLMIKHNFSITELQHFETALKHMLQQLYWVMDDQAELQKNLQHISSHLNCLDISRKFAAESTDAKEFLKGLCSKYFLFLGGRYFKLKMSESNKEFFCLEDTGAMHITGLYRDEMIADADELVPVIARARIIPDDAINITAALPLISVLKTAHLSPIYWRSRIESVEILDWSEDGKIQGVYQFVGIFKKEMYNTSAFDIPWLETKAKNVLNQFNVDPSWHNGKNLISIINSIPRDEMFYLSDDQLIHICQRVLELQENPGDIAVFIRHDDYGRYLTIMLYLPRQCYSFDLKERLGKIVCERFNGEISSSYGQVDDLPYARIVFVLNFAKSYYLAVDIDNLEEELSEASMNWIDRFDKYEYQESEKETSSQFLSLYKHGFSNSYQEHFSVEEAIKDILILEGLNKDQAVISSVL